MRILIVLAALAAVACAPGDQPAPAASEAPPAASAPATPVTAAPAPADQASCAARGGEWRPVCRMQQPACVMTFSDAGKACTDGDDCAGDCLARNDAGFAVEGKAVTGVCAVNDDPCGCKQTVEGGKATTAICID